MKLTIIAIGKMKNSAYAGLFNDYVQRIPWKISVIELQSPKSSGNQLRDDENKLLQQAIPPQSTLIILDEKGKEFSSETFAKNLEIWRQTHHTHLCFVIGGADGINEQLRKRAHVLMSLGIMTWPHMLVRVLLAEQLYRAYSISQGHPYHRS
ncbi:MAG: 23S rRNA (pseudouridine(1915)-N(3))-methyltransferase RlmH [Alphaproteobacteria bacterium]|nr:23S rRNA (pseudouridine(1915)-N(3))-methyltransferase RlmH [Alphaproteobacteria bacterium]